MAGSRNIGNQDASNYEYQNNFDYSYEGNHSQNVMPTGYPNQEEVSAFEAELASLTREAYPKIFGLVEKEIFNLRGGICEQIDLLRSSKVKIRAKVTIPQEGDNVNYIGRLLGPRGETLKNLQVSTATKMAILGKGSMRDDEKEQEMLAGGDPKYQHLKQGIHLQIDSTADASEAYYRMSHALAEVRRCMYEIANSNSARGGMHGHRGRGGHNAYPTSGYPGYEQSQYEPEGTGYVNADPTAGKMMPRGRGRGGPMRPYSRGYGGRPV